jgi:hypothetical protein
MAWEQIEEKLKKAFTVQLSFPAGSIWLPQKRLRIDEWLESIAETDEEWRELEIPRIQFLQNRWRMDELLELEWQDDFCNQRVILAMYVGPRAYILFSDWTDYLAVAALEPNDKPALYQAVIGKILENRSFIPRRPTRIKNHHPELVPEIFPWPEGTDLEMPRSVFDAVADLGRSAWNRFLSDVLAGWIGKWLNLPELGFWHEEMPESITKTDEGQILMTYKTGDDKPPDRQR